MQIFWNKKNFAKNAAGDQQMHNLHELSEPVTGQLQNYIAGNRRMQPVTGEMTWFGLGNTYKEKTMVASTIF